MVVDTERCGFAECGGPEKARELTVAQLEPVVDTFVVAAVADECDVCWQ
jgi:hypothetical protein